METQTEENTEKEDEEEKDTETVGTTFVKFFSYP